MSVKWIYRFGIILIVSAAWFTKGYFHPDEHFQLLEFANWKAGFTPAEDLTWEFSEKMRPALQPVIAWLFIAGSRAAGLFNPFVVAFLLRLASGLTAFWMYKKWAGTLTGKDEQPFFLWLVFGCLFMPMLSVRFSSENYASLLLLLGTLYLWNYSTAKNMTHLLWAGLLLGVSFSFRFQMAFAVLGASVWLIYYHLPQRKHLIVYVLSGIAGVAAGIVADRWFYGEWVITPWNYFQSNIIEKKAAAFGVYPWWWYLPEFIIRAVPPLSLVLLAGMVAGIRRQRHHIFTWVLIAFVSGHCLIGHKELRFLFPVLIPFLWLAAHGLVDFTSKRWWPMVKKTTIAVNMPLLLYNTFAPMQLSIGMFQFLHQYPNIENIQVFAEKASPFRNAGLEMHFYRPDEINVKILDQTASAAAPENVQINTGDLLMIESKKPINTLYDYKLKPVYGQLPEWFSHFNFNDWQSRTKWWNGYLIDD